MQNPTSINISPISERLLALIAEGVEKFKVQEDITQCRKCPLAQYRQKVLIANATAHKKFFVLSEYADQEDENSIEFLFHPQSSAGIVSNLIKKLGIENLSHFSFALKCVPYQHTPEVGLSTCITQNLLQEISQIQPSFLFCFGARTFYTLAMLDPSLFHQAYMPVEKSLPSLSEAFSLNLNGQNIELYLLPTAQELKQFPHWRKAVWAQLAHFKKNIDS